MAHAQERRTALRGLYVYKQLTLEAACGAAGVPKTTASRWKAEARAKGDDWDAARAAVAMGDENFTQLSRRLLQDYLVQHQAVITLLTEDKDMKPAQRTQLLASLSDSFHKTMASFKKLLPEENRLAVAMDSLQRLGKFTHERYPQHMPALLEILEPFGAELARAYG